MRAKLRLNSDILKMSYFCRSLVFIEFNRDYVHLPRNIVKVVLLNVGLSRQLDLSDLVIVHALFRLKALWSRTIARFDLNKNDYPLFFGYNIHLTPGFSVIPAKYLVSPVLEKLLRQTLGKATKFNVVVVVHFLLIIHCLCHSRETAK